MEKKSLYFYEETYKTDIEVFKKILNIKYKKDIKFILVLVLAMVVLLIALLLSLFKNTYIALYLGSMLLIFIALLINKKTTFKRNQEFLDLQERHILQEAKKLNATAISAVYPIYIFTDNLKKEFSLKYQGKKEFSFSYESLEKYEIYCDKELVGTRLPDAPDPKIKSYIISLIFKDEIINIGFSNFNKYIKLKYTVGFLQYTNTKAINKLALILEKIIKNNRV